MQTRHEHSAGAASARVGTRPGRALWALILARALSACASESLDGDLAAAARAPLALGPELPDCQLSGVVRLDEACSAVLVHPRVVLYPAHCRGPLSRAHAGQDAFAIERCMSYPDGTLFGTDIGVCVLSEPVRGRSMIAPALGCERDAIVAGASAWVVGYGATKTEPAGVKHLSHAVVQEVGDEIVVAGPSFGACAGDSGGPLFVAIDDRGRPALRLAGIVSASSREDCGVGTAYVTPVWPFVAWIEAETGLDVSPCGEPDGVWRPSADCLSYSAADLESGSCDAHWPSLPSGSCGMPAVSGSPSSYAGAAHASSGCQIAAIGAARSACGLLWLAIFACSARMRQRHRAAGLRGGSVQDQGKMGRYVGRTIGAEVADPRPRRRPPLSYVAQGCMLRVGRARAVAQRQGKPLCGVLAWWAGFMHPRRLVAFPSRHRLLLRWAWAYLRYRRGARLISGGQRLGAATALAPEGRALSSGSAVMVERHFHSAP